MEERERLHLGLETHGGASSILDRGAENGLFVRSEPSWRSEVIWGLCARFLIRRGSKLYES